MESNETLKSIFKNNTENYYRKLNALPENIDRFSTKVSVNGKIG